MMWLIVVLPACALLMTGFNLWVWPRGRARPENESTGDISVLVPARNEALNIEACIRAIASAGRAREILVYDDRSTDDTGAILRRLETEIETLRVLEAQALPAGWVGKPHACHQLAEQARGSRLVFVDADVRVHKGAWARLDDIFRTYAAQMVSASPRQVMKSFGERLVIPLLNLTYTSWLPLPLVWRSKDPRFLAVNGQLLAIEREAYDHVGGHAAIRDCLVDDMALGRRAKEMGLTVLLADGFELATCRMYRSFSEVWSGFSKNLYPGIGARLPILAIVLTLYIGAFVLPYVALAAGLGGLGSSWASPLVAPAAVAVAINVLLRTALAVRFSQPPEGVVLQPLSVLVLIAILFNSLAWTLEGRVEWRGRTYDPKALEELSHEA